MYMYLFHVYSGTHSDEMCNFYMMYYTDGRDRLHPQCAGNRYPDVFSQLPADNDVPLPPNPALEEQVRQAAKLTKIFDFPFRKISC